MLHTKFRGNRPASSGEENFLRVFTIYWHGGHLGHVTSIISANNYFLVFRSLHLKFGYKWPTGFREKHVLIFIHKSPWAKVKK